jgi:uncharacterized protein (TIGR02594 family)
MSILDNVKKYLMGNLDDAPEADKKSVKLNADQPLQIVVAKKWHGRHEEKDNARLELFLKFNPAKTAWCAGFVNAVEKECGREGTNKLNAQSYLKYGTVVDKPVLGDIVVFKRGKLPWQGHVGYYISEDDDNILVLGGNQNNKVCYKYYPKASLLGYRRP